MLITTTTTSPQETLHFRNFYNMAFNYQRINKRNLLNYGNMSSITDLGFLLARQANPQYNSLCYTQPRSLTEEKEIRQYRDECVKTFEKHIREYAHLNSLYVPDNLGDQPGFYCYAIRRVKEVECNGQTETFNVMKIVIEWYSKEYYENDLYQRINRLKFYTNFNVNYWNGVSFNLLSVPRPIHYMVAERQKTIKYAKALVSGPHTVYVRKDFYGSRMIVNTTEYGITKKNWGPIQKQFEGIVQTCYVHNDVYTQPKQYIPNQDVTVDLFEKPYVRDLDTLVKLYGAGSHVFLQGIYLKETIRDDSFILPLVRKLIDDHGFSKELDMDTVLGIICGDIAYQLCHEEYEHYKTGLTTCYMFTSQLFQHGGITMPYGRDYTLRDVEREKDRDLHVLLMHKDKSFRDLYRKIVMYIMMQSQMGLYKPSNLTGVFEESVRTFLKSKEGDINALHNGLMKQFVEPLLGHASRHNLTPDQMIGKYTLYTAVLADYFDLVCILRRCTWFSADLKFMFAALCTYHMFTSTWDYGNDTCCDLDKFLSFFEDVKTTIFVDWTAFSNRNILQAVFLFTHPEWIILGRERGINGKFAMDYLIKMTKSFEQKIREISTSMLSMFDSEVLLARYAKRADLIDSLYKQNVSERRMKKIITKLEQDAKGEVEKSYTRHFITKNNNDIKKFDVEKAQSLYSYHFSVYCALVDEFEKIYTHRAFAEQYKAKYGETVPICGHAFHADEYIIKANQACNHIIGELIQSFKF